MEPARLRLTFKRFTQNARELSCYVLISVVSVARLPALSKTTARGNRIVLISTTVFDVRTSSPVRAKLAPITRAIIAPVAGEQVLHNPPRTATTGTRIACPVATVHGVRTSGNSNRPVLE